MIWLANLNTIFNLGFSLDSSVITLAFLLIISYTCLLYTSNTLLLSTTMLLKNMFPELQKFPAHLKNNKGYYILSPLSHL